MRQARNSDVEICANILHESFTVFAEHHSLPSDFPTRSYALNSISYVINHPKIFGLVEEIEDEVAGFAFTYERDKIHAIGPVAVAKKFQDKGVAKRIMMDLIERSENDGNCIGVRLLTDTFNSTSLSLYMKLGFVARETCLVVKGIPKSKSLDGYTVRELEMGDLDECEVLCKKVHGVERTNELIEAIQTLSPYVALRNGRIVSYTTTMTRWHRAHGVAYSNMDMEALILGVGELLSTPLSFLMPITQSGLVMFCLSEGFEVIKPMTLLARGIYQIPNGCYFPSVLY